MLQLAFVGLGLPLKCATGAGGIDKAKHALGQFYQLLRMKVTQAGLGLADVEFALKKFALKKSGSDIARKAVPYPHSVG